MLGPRPTSRIDGPGLRSRATHCRKSTCRNAGQLTSTKDELGVGRLPEQEPRQSLDSPDVLIRRSGSGRSLEYMWLASASEVIPLCEGLSPKRDPRLRPAWTTRSLAASTISCRPPYPMAMLRRRRAFQDGPPLPPSQLRPRRSGRRSRLPMNLMAMSYCSAKHRQTSEQLDKDVEVWIEFVSRPGSSFLVTTPIAVTAGMSSSSAQPRNSSKSTHPDPVGVSVRREAFVSARDADDRRERFRCVWEDARRLSWR